MARPLIRAYGLLVVLSATSTTLALILPGLIGWQQAAAGATILLLAWLKARLILNTYLGLSAAPFWRRGFETVLGIFVIALLALYLLPLI